MGRSRVTSTSGRKKPSRFVPGLVALALVAAGGERAPEEVALDALQKRYETCRDLHARFEQTSTVSAFGEPTVSKGAVVVQRPGKIRWTYDPPDGRVIVLDGKTIQLYSPEDHQLQIAPLDKGGVSPTALSFLMGGGHLQEEFSARLVPQEAAAQAQVLDLIPRGDPSFESLRLWLDPKTHELRESELVDLFGNRTRLALSGAECNRGVAADAFRVEYDKSSTQVIDVRKPD
jgi:outer membrane lipoprotein carrier protein